MSEKPETEARTETHGDSVRTLATAMLRTAIWPAVGVLILCAVLFALWHGTAGLLGALVGGAIGVACTFINPLLMRKTADHGPHVALMASMGGFAAKMLVLFLGVSLLRGVEALHPVSLGVTMAAVILVSVGAEAVAFRRTRVPTIIPAGEK